MLFIERCLFYRKTLVVISVDASQEPQASPEHNQVGGSLRKPGTYGMDIEDYHWTMTLVVDVGPCLSNQEVAVVSMC